MVCYSSDRECMAGHLWLMIAIAAVAGILSAPMHLVRALLARRSSKRVANVPAGTTVSVPR
jgi:hypothetical protein